MPRTGGRGPLRTPLVAAIVAVVAFGAAEGLAAQLTLTWIDNSDGAAAFSIERRNGASAFAEIASVAPGDSTFVDTTLAPGSTYCYRVRAFDAFGESPYSDEACGATPYTITVSRAGRGVGTVTSTPGGITCGSDCSETFMPGVPITLVATASPGSAFAGWSGSGCAGSGPCVLAGNVSITVTATFCRSVTGRCEGK